MQTQLLLLQPNKKMPSNRRDPKRKVKVCFNEKVKAVLIRSRRSYTAEEVDASWYSDNEYKAFFTSRSTITYPKEDGEMTSDACSRERIQNRKRTIKSVLKEQQLQYMLDEYDGEKIREAAARCSERSVKEGIRRAEETMLSLVGIVSPNQHPAPKSSACAEFSLLKSSFIRSQMDAEQYSVEGQTQPCSTISVDERRADLMTVLDEVLSLLDEGPV